MGKVLGSIEFYGDIVVWFWGVETAVIVIKVRRRFVRCRFGVFYGLGRCVFMIVLRG